LWSPDFPVDIIPGDIVIEGFGCRLPESFLQAMAARSAKPVWLNLEYLSAESWTLDCHGLQSRHPELPLQQYFYFPGFDERSGGLLREQDLLQQRDEFRASPARQQQFWQELGYPQALSADYRLSLFAYENAAIPALLTALSQQPKSCFIAVPAGRALTSVQQWAGSTLTVGDMIHQGSVTVAVLPFLDSAHYDRLLWACDLNLVRGEDSFVRAHWAGKALLWQIYRQEENAHLDKLEAWLAVSKAFVDEDWQTLQRAWVGENADGACWSDLLVKLDGSQIGHRAFADSLSQQPDLSQKLVSFCTKQAAI
jgi:uncharacterized repeat protein (TIGR03837 family)